MPHLSKAEQHSLGHRLAEITAPLPRDERLLLLIAAFYGEAKSQGYSASQMLDFAARTVNVHDKGLQPLHIALVGIACPTCGGAL